MQSEYAPVNFSIGFLCHITDISRSCRVNYLDDLGTIQTVSDTLSHDLSRVCNILQDTIMDRCQSSCARALDS